jgi:predicted MPP superfamily phosphohydrolase
MSQAPHNPGEPGCHPRPADAGSYRRPDPPAPLEIHEIRLAALPPELDGFTVLHLTDIHVTRGRPRPEGIRRLLAALKATPVDLVALTGDYMTTRGDEETAAQTLAEIAGAWRSRLGAFGVFGNHDTIAMEELALKIPGVRWLRNEWADLEIPGAGSVRVLGASYPEDLFGVALSASEAGSLPSFTMTLAHYPTEIYPASVLGLPLVLAGHTHGGQLRLSARHAPHTSTDLMGGVASGLLRLRETTCVVSRGIGQALIEARWNCPAQAPLLVLRSSGSQSTTTQELEIMTAW